MDRMTQLANLQQRGVARKNSPALGAVLLMLFSVLAAGWAGGPGTAAAEPTGCTTDTSVTNELTLQCEPGAGAGEHAYIRCRDLLGMPHTHIGPAIGTEGGWSTAVCAPYENGPI